MAGYIIAEIEVTDPEAFERYREMVPATIAEFGGRYVVRGGAVESLEGDWSPKRLVVLEFESLEQARAWWASETYRAARDLRQRSSIGRLIAVQGV